VEVLATNEKVSRAGRLVTFFELDQHAGGIILRMPPSMESRSFLSGMAFCSIRAK
jgi:hypothetical protein